MKQFFYQLIYNPHINFLIRNFTKILTPLVPPKLRISPSGVLKIKNAQGNVMKIKTNQTNYLTRLIYWEGGYQKFEYTPIFIKLIKKIETFYDVGANIGFYSLVAAMENEKVRVVAFEPSLGPLFYLNENVRINNFQNIRVVPLALSQKNGFVEFKETINKKYKYLKHNLAGENSIGTLRGQNFVSYNVETITLDDFVFANSEDRVDLIKMDTEGTENLILAKSDRVLSEMKPIIICETLFNRIEEQLEEILVSYGYEFFNHTENGLEKVPTIRRKKDDGIRDCFFVHPSKYHLIEEFVDIYLDS